MGRRTQRNRRRGASRNVGGSALLRDPLSDSRSAEDVQSGDQAPDELVEADTSDETSSVDKAVTSSSRVSHGSDTNEPIIESESASENSSTSSNVMPPRVDAIRIHREAENLSCVEACTSSSGTGYNISPPAVPDAQQPTNETPRTESTTDPATDEPVVVVVSSVSNGTSASSATAPSEDAEPKNDVSYYLEEAADLPKLVGTDIKRTRDMPPTSVNEAPGSQKVQPLAAAEVSMPVPMSFEPSPIRTSAAPLYNQGYLPSSAVNVMDVRQHMLKTEILPTPYVLYQPVTSGYYRGGPNELMLPPRVITGEPVSVQSASPSSSFNGSMGVTLAESPLKRLAEMRGHLSDSPSIWPVVDRAGKATGQDGLVRLLNHRPGVHPGSERGVNPAVHNPRLLFGHPLR